MSSDETATRAQVIADFEAGLSPRDPFDDIATLIAALRRLEGDLAVAVQEATTLRAQRQAVLDLCDQEAAWEPDAAVVSTSAVRAALGAVGTEGDPQQ